MGHLFYGQLDNAFRQLWIRAVKNGLHKGLPLCWRACEGFSVKSVLQGLL